MTPQNVRTKEERGGDEGHEEGGGDEEGGGRDTLEGIGGGVLGGGHSTDYHFSFQPRTGRLPRPK